MPEDVQKLIELLPSAGKAFSDQRMLSLGHERTSQQKAIAMLQEHLRLHTQHVRNWGYFDQVRKVIEELYAPIDLKFREAIGMEATSVAQLFLRLVRSAEASMTSRLARLRLVLSERTPKAMVDQYYRQHPDLIGTADEFDSYVRDRGMTKDQLRGAILAHADLRLPEIFMISPEELSKDLEQSEEAVSSVLKKLSLSTGDLFSQPPERLLLTNPIWRKPLIALGNKQYFCPMPQMFFSFMRQCFDELIGENGNLREACERRRAEFLEQSIVDLFRNKFPGTEIVSGFKWRDGSQVFENDLIVRIDTCLFLIEAKSGAVSIEALRGAEERAKKHVRELIVSPSVQSERLAARIRAVVKDMSTRENELPGLDIDLSRVRTVLRLSITLEDFATVQANLHLLDRTGWLPEGHRLAPCMTLTDLEAVTDLLDSVGQRLTYLRRRTDFTRTITTLGDELDHLGFFLMTGFNIGEAEFGGVCLQLVGMSQAVDRYFIARAEGITVKKPILRLSPMWNQLCDVLERRKFFGWSDAFSILLSLSYDEQQKAERMLTLAKRNVRLNRRDPKHLCTIAVIPTERKQNGLVLYAFAAADAAQRHGRMQAAADEMFANDHVQKCLVVAINIDDPSSPYATLGLYFRGEDASGVELDNLTVY